MKKFVLATTLILASANAMAGSTMHYYYAAYKARVGDRMQCIFEKNISAIKVADGDSTDYQAKLNAQYVAFLKEKHPEYYRDWVRGDNRNLDFNIQAHSKLAWYFQTEKSALNSRAAEVALCKKDSEQDPKNYLPVVEVDEFIFKN